MYEMEKRENGQTVIYRTDSEADFIRHVIEDTIEQYDVKGQVTAAVEDVGEGWTRVQITYSPDLNPDEWMNIGGDFLAAFGPGGKGWYDCRASGANDGGTVEWWIVKHDHGPWI